MELSIPDPKLVRRFYCPNCDYVTGHWVSEDGGAFECHYECGDVVPAERTHLANLRDPWVRFRMKCIENMTDNIGRSKF